jgi:hypothetical protein
MYYIGLDVHKKTISYCVKDAAGRVHQEGRIGSTRCELDAWKRYPPIKHGNQSFPLQLRALASSHKHMVP